MAKCKRGHEQTEENTTLRANGRRECRPCKVDRTREWRQKNPEVVALRKRQYDEANKETINARQRDYNARIKSQIVAGYGGKCSCCGESHPAFLTIDHTNNDGGGRTRENHRKLYLRLIAQGFPRDGFDLVCFNCNTGRHINGGVCPHRSGEWVAYDPR